VNAAEQAAIAKWWHQHIGPLSQALVFEPLSGGQSNPTYRLSSGAQQWVLRSQPPGPLLPSAHAVDREYRVMHALSQTDVPVPQMLALCTDVGVMGRQFYVMSHVQGRVLVDPSLPGMGVAERGAIYQEMQRVAAAIHRVDPVAVGLAGFGRPDHYRARQLQRWSSQYRATQTEAIASMDLLMAWLETHAPSSSSTGLVHGDLRLDNVIFHPTQARVLAVIDWELSTLGDPEVDFAYHCMAWRLTWDEFRGMREHDLPALGIPSEAEHLHAWCRLSGRTVPKGPDWEYLMALNMFRLAAILQGIRHRALQGNAASADAVATGARARLLADAGWRVVQALG
jgi:aminoglycoside phosphotransferase (APT) family kinase protein